MLLLLQKTPRFAETELPKSRCKGPRGQMVGLLLHSVRAVLAAFARFLHYEEGAQRGPVLGVGTLLLPVFAELHFRNAHAEIRERPPDKWVR